MSNFSTVNLDIDGKVFNLEYYSYFNDYYSLNGRMVEPQTRKWFLNELKETDVIFDVGAHIGLYTILFSLKTNNVTSFEPTETYESLLIPNLRNNNITTPKLEKLALGSNSGVKKDKIFRIWGNPAEELDYTFTTLDEYIIKNNVLPNVIKIDVDSFDYEVLLGGKEYLSSNNVTVCVEVSNALSHRGYNVDNIKNLMSDMGYKIINVLDGENVIYRK
jgi:FkbM family methyltransferase